MNTEWRIFGIVAVFLYAVCGTYAAWTNSANGGVEWIGTVALVLSALLCSMCAGYFWFVSRRIDPRPEDRDEAEISDGAGEVGFFSPGSYWPVGLAAAAITAGLGLIYFMWWLIIAGVVAVLLTVGGLVFEYYTGARREAH
jgi:hypothetical protein